MKRLLQILAAAVAGSACGSGIRQLVEHRRAPSPERPELVIAPSPAGIGAGVVAGLVFGLVFGRNGLPIAFVVAANVGANANPETMARLAEKLRPGD